MKLLTVIPLSPLKSLSYISSGLPVVVSL